MGLTNRSIMCSLKIYVSKLGENSIFMVFLNKLHSPWNNFLSWQDNLLLLVQKIANSLILSVIDASTLD